MASKVLAQQAVRFRRFRPLGASALEIADYKAKPPVSEIENRLVSYAERAERRPIIAAIDKLAIVLRNQGKYPEAEALSRRALAEQRQAGACPPAWHVGRSLA